MITHTIDRLPITGNRFLQLIAPIAIVSAVFFVLSGCSSNDEDKNDKQAQDEVPDATEGTDASQSDGDDGGGGSEGDGGSAEVPDATEPAEPFVLPNPKVVKVDPNSGSLSHPWGYTPAVKDFDYSEEEFFFSAKTPSNTPYTTRMVVRRPKDPAKFSGTVYVEWYNVSGMVDVDPLWSYSWEYFMGKGHAQVSVSAQTLGAGSLKMIDPVRYEAIDHTDEFGADSIFSQAAVAIREQSDLILGPGMTPEALIGMGQSQSSMKLSSYIDNTHPTDQVYDGFITHTGSEPASNDPGAPTFVIRSMTEGNGVLDDGPTLVKWVVAGATHTEGRTVVRGMRLAKDVGLESVVSGLDQCSTPANTYPSYRVYNAVCDWMHRWIRYGEKPPSMPPLQGDSPWTGYQLDEYGNALGGVRLPELEVPTAVYSVLNFPGDGADLNSALCVVVGSSAPFSEEKLLELYPTHEDYVKKYKAATEKAVSDGILLEEDAKDAIAEAEAAPIPN